MEDWIWILVPLTALMIPIVAILTTHRRKIIELKLRHKSLDEVNAARQEIEFQSLRTEVKELRDALHAQLITMDSLISGQAKLLEMSENEAHLERRIGGGVE